MKKRPHLLAIFLLRCPQCAKTPLRQAGSWFIFRDHCVDCRYRFEREEGYFLGSPWMINYPLTAVLSFAVAFYLFSNKAELGLSSLGLSLSVAGFAALTSLFLFPFAKATWMVLDQFIHPISDAERLSLEKKLSNNSKTV